MKPFKTLRRLWTGSIRRQLMLGIALVHAVMMTIFVLDLVHRERQMLLEESRHQAIALTEVLAANGTSWLLSNDFMGIEEVISSQKRFPGLLYAMFVDPRGEVLGYTERQRVGTYLNDEISLRLLNAKPGTQILIDNAAQIDVAHPVLMDGALIGWARVGISRDGIMANLTQATTDGLIYTVAAIAIGLLFAWLMAKGLTGDIQRLVKVAERFRAGEADLPALSNRPDEVGDLSRGMRQMLVTVADKSTALEEANQNIASDERRLRYALEGSSDGLWDWDLVRNEFYYSVRWKEMLGYAEAELENTFDTWRSLVHPDDLDQGLAILHEHLADPEVPYENLLRLKHKSGQWRWMLSRGRALRNAKGKAERMVGTHMDVSVERELQRSLDEERKRALITLCAIGDGVIRVNAHGSIVFLNPAAEQFTGHSKKSAYGKPLSEVFSITDSKTGKRTAEKLQRVMAGELVFSSDSAEPATLTAADSKTISVQYTMTPVVDDEEGVLGAVLVFRDVTQAHALQQEMAYRARHDALTGLLNRGAFDMLLASRVAQAEEQQTQAALVYIDLDQFKVVNDTVGHLAGDELLKQIAVLLESKLGDSHILARLGGDEFALLIDSATIEQATDLANELRADLEQFRFSWKRHQFQISGSFGIAMIDSNLSDTNILGMADMACYSAKEKGRNRVDVYRPTDRELRERRSEMEWIAKIKSALDDERFVLCAQRILPLRGANACNGQIREVLVRMIDDRDGTLIAPGVFIPAAERYGVMTSIDLMVVRKALNWLVLSGKSNAYLSVNISAMSLADQELLELIEQQLDERPELARRLCLEITETAAIRNLRKSLEFMQRLKQREVSFALDDFGSGMSSFSYLKALPVDFVKIDGHFIRDLSKDRYNEAMVEAICRVANELNIKTVAEYVEDESLLERLKDLGVDYAQGYAIEKPQLLSEPMQSPRKQSV